MIPEYIVIVSGIIIYISMISIMTNMYERNRCKKQYKIYKK